jgi:CubicO group peptidase (beta-lactamase class C family)
MSRKKKLYFFSGEQLFCLFVAFLAAILSRNFVSEKVVTTAEVATGYGAKLACSYVFVSDRTLESALEAEFVFPPIKWGALFEVDDTRRCVTATATFLKSVSQTACWKSDHLGCSLLSEGTEPARTASVPKEQPIPSAEQWPLGSGPPVTRGHHPDVDWEVLDRTVDAHFADSRLHARAFLLIRGGELIYEQYGDGCHAGTAMLGWSSTKSIVSALLGRMAMAGMVSLDMAVDLPEWKDTEMTRPTVRQMLQMSDGLDWDEWYEPTYDVTDMLFRQESAFMPDRTSRVPPGQCFQYSSHTTNALCLWMRHLIEDAEEARPAWLQDYEAFPFSALFEPLRASSFVLETDPSGTFVGSSFGWATARDWAKFGQLYLNDGMWSGQRLLPEGWTEFSSTPTDTSGGVYGAHFWTGGEGADGATADRVAECDGVYPSRLNPDRSWWRRAFPSGTYAAHGFEEQLVAMVPSKGVVMVRLGATKEVVLSWEKEEFYSAVLAALPDILELET